MTQIKLKGALTPRFINRKLGPFLEALANLQHTIDEIKQAPPSAFKVLEISEESVAHENENETDIELGDDAPDPVLMKGLREVWTNTMSGRVVSSDRVFVIDRANPRRFKYFGNKRPPFKGSDTSDEVKP